MARGLVPGRSPPVPLVVAPDAGKSDAPARSLPPTTGDGHPESAGVVACRDYSFTLHEFREGKRNGGRSGVMIAITKGMTDAEMKEAAAYFGKIRPAKGYVKVIEAAEVPKTYVGAGAMRFVSTGAEAGKEPIGNRIITVPQDEDAAEARNPRHGFNHYVPPGSIKKGEDLVKNGGNGKTVPCAVCHGPDLRGLGEVPPIANRDLVPIQRLAGEGEACQGSEDFLGASTSYSASSIPLDRKRSLPLRDYYESRPSRLPKPTISTALRLPHR
jgi:cytochrome c553